MTVQTYILLDDFCPCLVGQIDKQTIAAWMAAGTLGNLNFTGWAVGRLCQEIDLEM